MISYRYSDFEEWILLTPTIFPDQCSQVWKITEPVGFTKCEIKWNFESESELIQVFQLSDLIMNTVSNIKLNIPYLPYGRQDKEISNNTTFGKSTFLYILSKYFKEIETYDVHSDFYISDIKINNQIPDHFLKAIKDFSPDAIFFPDHGAMTRYQKMFLDNPKFNIIPRMYGEKIRNQQTGEITDYKVYAWKDNHDGERVLILDDLIDAGATFINASRELKKIGVTEIGLCVSHGIFSKGTNPLREAGISKFYTTDSFVRNKIENTDNIVIYGI